MRCYIFALLASGASALTLHGAASSAARWPWRGHPTAVSPTGAPGQGEGQADPSADDLAGLKLPPGFEKFLDGGKK